MTNRMISRYQMPIAEVQEHNEQEKPYLTYQLRVGGENYKL